MWGGQGLSRLEVGLIPFLTQLNNYMRNISFCIALNFSQERWLAQVLPFNGELPV